MPHEIPTFITVEDTWTVAFDDYMESLGCPRFEEPVMCECEMDWNCGLHAHRQGTWLETRFAMDDEDEARAAGRWEIEYGSWEPDFEAMAERKAEARRPAWAE